MKKNNIKIYKNDGMHTDNIKQKNKWAYKKGEMRKKKKAYYKYMKTRRMDKIGDINKNNK